MSTPTSSTLNGGSTMVPEQTSDANKASEGQKPLPGSPSADRITSGMTCGSQVPVTIPPIQRGKDGNTRGLGDITRASVDRAASNGGPRNAMGQHPLSGRTSAAPAPFASETEGSEGDRA